MFDVRRSPRSSTVYAAFALSALGALAVACDGGGGDPPTAPRAIVFPAIAGSWSGGWEFDDGSLAVGMALNQSSEAISGTMNLEELEIPITGSVSVVDTAGESTFTWQIPASELECGSVGGSLRVSHDDTRMAGTGRISTAGCEDEPLEELEGAITLARSSASSSPGSFAADPGEPGRLVVRLVRPVGRR